MKLPDYINFVMLSATVPNFKEFADWVGRTKKKLIYVQMTEKRPVPLQHFFLQDRKLHMIKNEHGQIFEDVISKCIKKAKDNAIKDRKQRNQAKNFGDGGDDPYDIPEEKEQKTIDFKQKAINAKQRATASMAQHAMKKANNADGKTNSQSATKYKEFCA